MTIEAENSQKLVFRKLDAIRDVPTLPAIALRAVEISNDDDSSAKELGEFISRDQALTSQLLTLVNAASYGVTGKVATVARAIVIMGFAKVRNVILASATANIFAGTSDCLDRNRLWVHSVATATGARILAKGAAGIEPETAYIAGLLHEVGIVILDRYFHDALRGAILQSRAKQIPVDQSLRELIGLDQYKIGSYLALRWQLPEVLQKCIGMHNYPPTADVDSNSIAAVHVASMIADACKMNYDPFASRKPIHANAISLLKITPIKIKSTAEELNRQRQHIEDFANLCSG